MMASALVCSAAACALARRHSTRMVEYVVEEALVQKALPATAPEVVRQRFERRVQSFPDPETRLEFLLSLSQDLEKIQAIEPGALDRAIGDRAGAGSAIPGNLSRRPESK